MRAGRGRVDAEQAMEMRGATALRGARRRIAALAAGLVLAASAAGAQPNVPPPQEQDRPAEGLEAAERARRAAGAAERLRPLGPGDRVTYADVLKNPDDVELNYLYAQTQVAAGELRGAASTLERILLVDPNLARVRLLYAVVLFRLDNLSEAEREFQTVSQLPMPENLRQEVDRYLAEIEIRKRATRYSASLGGGMQWDSNRNAGPLGDDVLFFDLPFTLVEGQAEADWSGVMLGSLRAQHDLGYDEGHLLTGALQLYGQKQINQPDLDLGSVSGEAGGLYRTPWFDVQPVAFGSYLNLAGESYVSAAGGGFRVFRRFSQRFEVSTRFRGAYEFFEPLERSPITEERQGPRFEAGLGAAYNPLPTLRIDANATYMNKQADVDYYTYQGPLAALSATYLLGSGQFLLGSFLYEWDSYEGPEPTISFRTRRDSNYLGRLTYGAPLGFLLGFLSPPKALRDTVFTVNGEYLYVDSNIENYAYDNWRVSLLFTKSFDF
jgi:hypothetical protein